MFGILPVIRYWSRISCVILIPCAACPPVPAPASVRLMPCLYRAEPRNRKRTIGACGVSPMLAVMLPNWPIRRFNALGT